MKMAMCILAEHSVQNEFTISAVVSAVPYDRQVACIL